MSSVLDRVENIVGKGENADYQHFLLFLHCFQKVFFSELLNLGLCGIGLMILTELFKLFTMFSSVA